MNIDTVLQVLNYLNLNYSVIHTEDYSEVRIPSNSPNVRDLSLLFDSGVREVYDKDYVDQEDE